MSRVFSNHLRVLHRRVETLGRGVLHSFTDGGFVGDPMLREWDSCPLGRTWRMVLFVFFGACPLLAEQLQESGTYVAMDKFFASPILFLCLLLQGSSLSESSAKSIVVRATRCGTGRLPSRLRRRGGIWLSRGLVSWASRSRRTRD